MLVTLDIDDAEVSFFIKLAKSLPFVNDITSEEEDEDLTPEWHLPILKERLKNVDDTRLVDATDFINSLK